MPLWQEIAHLPDEPMRSMRRHLQITVQDPSASLNPRRTIGDILAEPMALHHIGSEAERADRVPELLAVVGLVPEHARRCPQQFSGGQRQCVGIARAMAVQPGLIVCDEVVSALDVSIQAQVVNLLQDLQQRFGLSCLFIAHDLAVVKHIADRVAVMYLGKLAEVADKPTLYARPLHPCTLHCASQPSRRHGNARLDRLACRVCLVVVARAAGCWPRARDRGPPKSVPTSAPVLPAPIGAPGSATTPFG
jgi:oligopeptide transport system ATP-binding protein